MLSARPTDSILEEPAWAPWLAGLVPLAVYVLTANAHSFWLDSAEFTAAAVDLDIAHPPGHPVAALWGRAFALLPIGPLPFRVGVAEGVAAAGAAAALQLAFARSFHVLGLRARWPNLLLSLGSVWCLAFAYGFWFQAVRAEVYALQTLLICLSLERLVALAADPSRLDLRSLYAATFYLGLGLANHHFMSVLALPALLPALIRALRKYGARVIGGCSASGAVGLIGYLYLPLRAASEPAMDLGHPVTWKSFWWVVSAQVYARRIGTEATQPMDERFADLAVILVEHFSFYSLPLAALGLYLTLRERTTRSVAMVWGITALISLGGRAWLNPVRNNPDVLGYMLPGFAGYVALTCSALLLLSRVLRTPRLRTQAGWVLGVTSLALASAQLTRTRAQASLADFDATDSFDQLRQASLPPAAVVFLTSPETTFRHWENRSVEGARPDVDMVPTAFVNYGAAGEVLLHRRPTLTGAVHAYQAAGVLTPSALAALTARRPVMIEPDLIASWPLFGSMVPAGLLYRLLPAPATREQVLSAAPSRERVLRQLEQVLGDQRHQVETQRQLLWLHFMDALYYASHAEHGFALASIRRGLQLAPEERELLRLRDVLQTAPQSFTLQQFLPTR